MGSIPTTAAPETSGLARVLDRSPVASAALVWVVDLLVALAAGVLATTLWPSANAALVTVVVLSVWVTVLLATLGWWRAAGFTGLRRWRNIRYVWPAAAILVVLPLLGGLHRVDAGTLVVFVVGYALTGFYEEAFFRGFLLRLLRPVRPRRAVFVAAALFGLAHLTNLFFRSGTSPVVTLFQAVGAFCIGVGLGALLLVTGTIWPLVLLHFGEDFFLHVGNLPILVVNPVQSVLMLGYGLFLLHRHRPWPGG